MIERSRPAPGLGLPLVCFRSAPHCNLPRPARVPCPAPLVPHEVDSRLRSEHPPPGHGHSPGRTGHQPNNKNGRALHPCTELPVPAQPPSFGAMQAAKHPSMLPAKPRPSLPSSELSSHRPLHAASYLRLDSALYLNLDLNLNPSLLPSLDRASLAKLLRALLPALNPSLLRSLQVSTHRSLLAGIDAAWLPEMQPGRRPLYADSCTCDRT